MLVTTNWLEAFRCLPSESRPQLFARKKNRQYFRQTPIEAPWADRGFISVWLTVHRSWVLTTKPKEIVSDLPRRPVPSHPFFGLRLKFELLPFSFCVHIMITYNNYIYSKAFFLYWSLITTEIIARETGDYQWLETLAVSGVMAVGPSGCRI